jgi:hypothetical protein
MATHLNMLTLLANLSIMEEVEDICEMGLATIALFNFNFQDKKKQNVHCLLPSILIQLCSQSDVYSEVLSTLFENYDCGSHQPSESTLRECLKTMLKLQKQGALYLIIDVLDECPNSFRYPTQ